jgi:hypothetical protein
MIKNVTFFLIILLLFLSCEENDTNTICDKVVIVCNTQNPLEDLDFLKDAKDNIDRIDCGDRSSIMQYTYKSETVFEVNICSQIADAETLIYNCSGEVVCMFGGISGENTCPDFKKEAKDKIILYGN